MKNFMRFLASMFGGYTGSTGPEGASCQCKCKCSDYSGKFGPG